MPNPDESKLFYRILQFDFKKLNEMMAKRREYVGNLVEVCRQCTSDSCYDNCEVRTTYTVLYSKSKVEQ